MKPIVIHTKAREELDNSVGYYEKQKAGLGLDFLSEVEQSISKIQQNSNIGAPYKIVGLRRYVIQHFPYLIFYAEFEEFIWIVAIAHSKRRPDYWRRRFQ
ncbi:type II toxin-antitoxin system RelE/ParE family toxin [Nostoc sp. DSM 114159]